MAALTGAATAGAAYHAASGLGYVIASGKIGGKGVDYRGWLMIQEDIQVSMHDHKEHGGVIMEDGSVKRFSSGSFRNDGIIDVGGQLGSADFKGYKAYYHTHHAKAGSTYQVDNDLNYFDATKHDKGTYTEVSDGTAQRYHTPGDLTLSQTLGKPNFVINRIDASYSNGTNNYTKINPWLVRTPLVYLLLKK